MDTTTRQIAREDIKPGFRYRTMNGVACTVDAVDGDHFRWLIERNGRTEHGGSAEVNWLLRDIEAGFHEVLTGTEASEPCSICGGTGWFTKGAGTRDERSYACRKCDAVTQPHNVRPVRMFAGAGAW